MVASAGSHKSEKRTLYRGDGAGLVLKKFKWKYHKLGKNRFLKYCACGGYYEGYLNRCQLKKSLKWVDHLKKAE